MTIKPRYFIIKTETGYVGERNEYYVVITMNSEEDPSLNLNLMKTIDDCVYENALEWYDENEVDETFDEYLEECSATWKEISCKEYEESTAEWLLDTANHSFED
jgi:hypothetical protein